MVVLEQSDCFVFREGSLITFNDEILVRTPSPLDFDTVVAAADFLKVLGKLPDQEVDVFLKGGELIVKGKRRSAGISTQAEVLLPYGDVPLPTKWSKIKEGVTGVLKQGARTCGKDLSHPLTTVVHVGPNVVEATDNFRVFRASFATGFPGNVLIPALALVALETVPLHKISINKGWAHFRSSAKSTVSVRCIADDYVDVSPALNIKIFDEVTLPGNLADIIDRSESMIEGSDQIVRVSIEKGLLSIRSEKESGWYREQKKIHYKGRSLKFHVNPKFLVEVLQRTSKVQIGKKKMKLEADGVEFVVVLEAAE